MFSIFAGSSETPSAADILRQFIENKISLSEGIQYTYMVINKRDPTLVLIISSYPEEWGKIYRGGNFQLTDPVVLTAFRGCAPFTWNEHTPLVPGLRPGKLFSQAKQYGVTRGVTFVLHDYRNNLALLSFIAPRASQLSRLLSSDAAEMQMSLIDINTEMYRLTDLTFTGGDNRSIKTRKDFLTPRENEVLHWVSMGKTYAETATILGLSVSTIKFHMHNIVSRLGVSNARQAVHIAAEMALITPIASSARQPPAHGSRRP